MRFTLESLVLFDIVRLLLVFFVLSSSTSVKVGLVSMFTYVSPCVPLSFSVTQPGHIPLSSSHVLVWVLLCVTSCHILIVSCPYVLFCLPCVFKSSVSFCFLSCRQSSCQSCRWVFSALCALFHFLCLAWSSVYVVHVLPRQDVVFCIFICNSQQ